MIYPELIEQSKELSAPSKMYFFLAFLCGAIAWHRLNIIGELYTTEIALFVFSIIILLTKKQPLQIDKDLFIKYIIFMVLLIFGYMLSDIVGDTPQNMYLRGWGRTVVLLIDIIAMTIIFGTHRNTIIWFFMGIAIGQLFFLLVSHKLYISNIKFGWGMPLVFIICCLIPLISNKLTSLVLLISGLTFIIRDFRSAGAACIVLGILLFLIARQNFKQIHLLPLVLAATLGFIAINIVVNVTDDLTSRRRSVSNTGRFAALSIGTQAIIDSPIIGSGSWGNNTEKYADALYKETQNEMRELGQGNYHKEKNFIAHSQIIQAWMEGGILAAMFFIFYGFCLLKSANFVLLNSAVNRYSAIYGVNLILGFWHLFMSPFGGNHRLNIAASVAITVSVFYYYNKDKLTKNNETIITKCITE